VLDPAIDTAVEIIKSFVLAGIDITMNQFNKRPPRPKKPKAPAADGSDAPAPAQS